MASPHGSNSSSTRLWEGLQPGRCGCPSSGLCCSGLCCFTRSGTTFMRGSVQSTASGRMSPTTGRHGSGERTFAEDTRSPGWAYGPSYGSHGSSCGAPVAAFPPRCVEHCAKLRRSTASLGDDRAPSASARCSTAASPLDPRFDSECVESSHPIGADVPRSIHIPGRPGPEPKTRPQDAHVLPSSRIPPRQTGHLKIQMSMAATTKGDQSHTDPTQSTAIGSRAASGEYRKRCARPTSDRTTKATLLRRMKVSLAARSPASTASLVRVTESSLCLSNTGLSCERRLRPGHAADRQLQSIVRPRRASNTGSMVHRPSSPASASRTFRPAPTCQPTRDPSVIPRMQATTPPNAASRTRGVPRIGSRSKPATRASMPVVSKTPKTAPARRPGTLHSPDARILAPRRLVRRNGSMAALMTSRPARTYAYARIPRKPKNVVGTSASAAHSSLRALMKSAEHLVICEHNRTILRG